MPDRFKVGQSLFPELFGRAELVFAHAAKGTDVIFGKIFPLYALGVLVVFVTAHVTYVYHFLPPFILFSAKAVYRLNPAEIRR